MKQIISKAKLGAALGSALATGLAYSGIALADSKDDVCKGVIAIGGKCDDDSLTTTTIPGIIKTMLFFVGILAVIMIIFAGIRYITAHGDKAQVQAATNTLIYSIVGLVVAILAYAIVSFVTTLF